MGSAPRRRMWWILAVVLASTAVGLSYVASGPRTLARPSDVSTIQAPSEYLWTDSHPKWGYSLIRPIVAEYLEALPSGARVLDLGCGNGVMLASFRGHGWDLVGVDISESAIAQARRAWPDVRFEIGDATGDLSSLGQFDAVISTEVIEHIVLPRRFASNAYTLLRPGGLLVLTTPYHGWLKDVAIAVSGQGDRHHQPLSDYGHIKFWSVSTLSQLLWEAGLDDVEYRGAGRAPYLWNSLIMVARRPRTVATYSR